MIGCSSEEKLELVFGNFKNKTVDYENLNGHSNGGDEIITQCSFQNAQFFLILKNISLIEEFYHCQNESDYTTSVFRYKAEVEQFLVGTHGYEKKEIIINAISDNPTYIENEEIMFLVGVYETQRNEYFMTNHLKIIYSESDINTDSGFGFTGYGSSLPSDMHSLSTVLGQTLTNRDRVCGSPPFRYHNGATNFEDAIYKSDRTVPVSCH